MKGQKSRSSLFSLRGAYLSSLISILLVILLLGITGFLLIHSTRLSTYAKENIIITIMMRDSIPEAEIRLLQKTLDADKRVKETQLISPAEAAKRMTQDTGEDFVSWLGYNPLPYSLDVKVQSDYANNDFLNSFTTEIQKNPIVRNAYYQQDLVQKINSNASKISLILFVFALLIFIISYALIHNTIRLSVYAKRFLIRSMLLVGATRAFIRRPFLTRSLIIGFIASLISIVFLELIIMGLYSQIPDLKSLQDNTMTALLFVFLLIAGLGISYISTILALNRYIKMKTDYLYF